MYHSHLDSCCEIFHTQSWELTHYSWPQADPLRPGLLFGNKGSSLWLYSHLRLDNLLLWGCFVHCGMCSSDCGTSTCDNQKCLQTLTNVPGWQTYPHWEPRSETFKEHWTWKQRTCLWIPVLALPLINISLSSKWGQWHPPCRIVVKSKYVKLN